MAPGRAIRPGATLSGPMADPTASSRLRVDDFDYELPPSAIAQAPAQPRDASRLLVLDRAASRPGRPALSHATFRDLGAWLDAGDLLVVNDSRVIPARLRGTRAGGGAAEVLALRPTDDDPLAWLALVRPSRRLSVGAVVEVGSGDRIIIGSRRMDGTRVVSFQRDPLAVMAAAGEMPLPPVHPRPLLTC